MRIKIIEITPLNIITYTKRSEKKKTKPPLNQRKTKEKLVYGISKSKNIKIEISKVFMESIKE